MLSQNPQNGCHRQILRQVRSWYRRIIYLKFKFPFSNSLISIVGICIISNMLVLSDVEIHYIEPRPQDNGTRYFFRILCNYYTKKLYICINTTKEARCSTLSQAAGIANALAMSPYLSVFGPGAFFQTFAWVICSLFSLSVRGRRSTKNPF